MVTIVLCGKILYDKEMIYERMIVLMSSNRSVPIDTFYDHRYCVLVEIVSVYSEVYRLSHQAMKKLITSSSSNIKGRRFEASLMTYVLVILPHLYVYHTRTRALRMSSLVASRSIVELGATVH